MVLFGIFSSPPEVTIKLEGDRPWHRRVFSSGPSSIPGVEQCPMVGDGDSLAGLVIIRQRPGQTLEHQGAYVEYVGVVERQGETAGKRNVFHCSRQQLLAPRGDEINKETVVLNFDLGALRMPFESYDGVGISVRYYVRAVIARKVTDIVREMTLWCVNEPSTDGRGPGVSSPSVELEVGLEEFLHIKLCLEQSRYKFDEEIRGVLRFLMVRVRIIDVQVNLVRKEIGTDDTLIQQTVLTSKQLLDGPAHRGDQVCMQLDLASVADRLTATMEAVNKMFSVRYYVGIVLRDVEGRKYYKQVEVEMARGASLSPLLPNYKFGLVNK